MLSAANTETGHVAREISLFTKPKKSQILMQRTKPNKHVADAPLPSVRRRPWARIDALMCWWLVHEPRDGPRDGRKLALMTVVCQPPSRPLHPRNPCVLKLALLCPLSMSFGRTSILLILRK